MAIKKSFAELPEPIITHILSFLPEKDATKTSILSKSWLRAWRTKPNLEFDSKLFLGNEMMIWGEEKEKRRKKFCEYLNRTLERYTAQNITIETLKLHLTRMYSVHLLVDLLLQRWMRVVVEKGVEKLDIFADNYDLPRVVVGANLLVELRLRELNMLHLDSEKIVWHSLKRLCLYLVYFDELLVQNIISSCPLLEILEISYCTDNVEDRGDNNLRFMIEHQSLKQLTATLYPRQRLILAETPKLESLICRNDEDHYEDVDWMPCGLSLHSSQYQNLKMLNLCAVGITDDFFNNLEQNFPHLRHVLVRYCQDLKKIRISSRSLQKIELMNNHNLEEAHFDVPSIELLDYICDECEIIPEFSFSTATNGHWISNLRLFWTGYVDSCWFLQLKKFLINLIPSEIFLDIEIGGSTIELDMNQIRNSLTIGEPQEIQELSLRLPRFLDSSSILSAMDCVFSVCRPNCISQRWENHLYNDDALMKFMKLFCDMLIFRKNQDQHQKLQQIKCWQHDLMQVKVHICEILLVGDSIVYAKKGLVGQQPEALDWESILKALNTHGTMRRMIYFTLNWKRNRCKRIKQSWLDC